MPPSPVDYLHHILEEANYLAVDSSAIKLNPKSSAAFSAG